MAAFTLTHKARADLKSIAAYTQRKWGKEQRRIYLKQFDDTFHLLANNPEVGTTCDFITLGYQKYANVSHVVFYRSLGDSQVEIVRILHKRMDVETSLRNP